MDYKEYQAGQTTDNFWYKAKNKLVGILLSKITASMKSKSLKILDVGPGVDGEYLLLNKYGDVYIVDVNSDVLKLIDEKFYLEKKLGDVSNLPFEDDFFDIVVMFDIFEHVKEDQKAVDEIYRVLKKDGILTFSVPAFQSLFSAHDKAVKHHRRYNKKDIENLFSRFKEMKISYWNSILLIPMGFKRILEKNAKPKVEYMELPKFLNYFLYILLSLDNILFNLNIPIPIGLSIIGYCKK